MSHIQSRKTDESQGPEHRRITTQFIAEVSAYFLTHPSIQFFRLNTATSACEQRMSMVVTRSLLGSRQSGTVNRRITGQAHYR